MMMMLMRMIKMMMSYTWLIWLRMIERETSLDLRIYSSEIDKGFFNRPVGLYSSSAVYIIYVLYVYNIFLGISKFSCGFFRISATLLNHNFAKSVNNIFLIFIFFCFIWFLFALLAILLNHTRTHTHTRTGAHTQIGTECAHYANCEKFP